jgi:hypothetical protein
MTWRHRRQHDGVLLRGSERELPLIPRRVCDDKMFARTCRSE